ncbi:unnamed protein product, partial [Brassica oleracea]
KVRDCLRVRDIILLVLRLRFNRPDFCLRRSRVLLRRWTAGFCFWVAVASSVPLRRLLSPCHAPLVLTAALTGVIPVSFDRRFCSSPLQSTLLPRFRCSMVEG